MKTLNKRTMPKSAWWEFTGEYNGYRQTVIHNVPDIDFNSIETIFKKWAYHIEVTKDWIPFAEFANKEMPHFTFLKVETYKKAMDGIDC